MKKLKYIFGLSFFLLSIILLNAQTNRKDGIFSLIIFENKGNGRIEINSSGEINLGGKISLDKANQNIEDFIIKNDYQKNPANNNPPPPAKFPTTGMKNTYIIMTLQKDFNNEKDFRNKTTYSKMYQNVNQDFKDYDILNLFSKKDQQIILNYFKK